MDSGGRRETASSLLVRALLLSGQGSTRMTSCNPNHLPEASPLNATPLGVIGLQHMNLEDTNIQSVKAAVRSLPAGAGRVPNVRAPPPGAHSTLMAALRWALRSPHFTGEETEARNCTMAPGLSAGRGGCGLEAAHRPQPGRPSWACAEWVPGRISLWACF